MPPGFCRGCCSALCGWALWPSSAAHLAADPAADPATAPASDAVADAVAAAAGRLHGRARLSATKRQSAGGLWRAGRAARGLEAGPAGRGGGTESCWQAGLGRRRPALVATVAGRGSGAIGRVGRGEQPERAGGAGAIASGAGGDRRLACQPLSGAHRQPARNSGAGRIFVHHRQQRGQHRSQHAQHGAPVQQRQLGGRSVGPHRSHHRGRRGHCSGQCRRSGRHPALGPGHPGAVLAAMANAGRAAGTGRAQYRRV